MPEQHCDVLIIGAGPAGLAAATAARSSGASVVVIDQAVSAGGQIWRHSVGAGVAADARIHLQRADLAGVCFAMGRRVVAAAETRTLLVETPQCAERWRYERLILACGARELLLPFPGWTLPGVTGAGGLQALVKGGWPLCGRRVVVAGSGPLLLAVAATAISAQADLRMIAEDASLARVARFVAGLWRHPRKLRQALQLKACLRGVEYRIGARVVAALGAERVEGVRLEQAGREFEIACDQLAVGYGLLPNSELGMLLGCAVRHDAAQPALAVDQWQRTDRDGIYAAGECTGISGVDAALAEGRIAGYAAVDRADRAREQFAARRAAHGFGARVRKSFAAASDLDARITDATLICRCEDVAWQSLREHQHYRAAKLATRCGMGHCQARICGAALAHLRGWPPPSPRPPLHPARLETWLSLAAGAPPVSPSSATR